MALVVIVIAGTVVAGSRYFYCPSMGESQFTSCCPEHEGDGNPGTAELVATSCCQSKVMRGLPSAQIDARPLVVSAPLLAVLSAVTTCDRPIVEPTKTRRVRWGSEPPTPSQARPHLMVFLT